MTAAVHIAGRIAGRAAACTGSASGCHGGRG